MGHPHALQRTRRYCSSRGSTIVMAMVLSVVLTSLVLVIAVDTGARAQMTGANVRLDQANAAAESAGQWAVWQFKHNNAWRQSAAPATLPTLVIGPNTYSFAVTCVDAGAAATLYWPFDEGSGLTTADTSGHNNTGQLIGGVTWTTGKYGKALQFDGSTGYVNAGNNPSTNILTMAAWVKMDTAGNDQKVGGNQSGDAGGYKMSIYGTKVEFEVRDTQNNVYLNRSVSGGTLLTLGCWYHVAGVYNAQNNSIKTYVNGALDRELDNVPDNALGSTTGSFIMGREPWTTPTRFFDGAIEDVRVYDRALSDQEIKTLASTSVHIRVVSSLNSRPGQSGTVDFISSAPTPLPPLAPALTLRRSLPLKRATVSGDVQANSVSGSTAASSVNGKVVYVSSYSDPQHYITITYKGKPSSATQNSGATVPTIDYASIQAQATSTGTAGNNKTYQFPALYNGQVPIIYVNGNVTNPTIDTSQSGGTLLINGTLTITGNVTYGSSGFPVYIITQNNVSQSGGTMTLNGGLYVRGTWTHSDCAITGDVCVTGNVTDNTATASTYIQGGIPWFDPRGNTPPIPVPIYYTAYQGVAP